MRIVIPDDYQDVVRTLDAYALLDGHDVTVLAGPPRDEDLAEVEALVLIRERTRVDAAFLDRAPRLRVISQTGRGTPHVDRQACEARGIACSPAAARPSHPPSSRGRSSSPRRGGCRSTSSGCGRGEWQRNGLEGTDGALGHVLRGRTLGVLGLGRIGALVAGYGAAFGMDVLAWDGSVPSGRGARRAHLAPSSQRALFERAAVLTVHVPSRPETRGLVTADDLAVMPDRSLFVNTSRAALVEPGVLVEALAAGRPAFAAVDVFDEEPTVADELLRLPNVVATPHLGYVERDTYEEFFGEAFRNLLAN